LQTTLSKYEKVMSNTTTNSNNNNSTSKNNDSAIYNVTNKHDIKTVHNDIFVPQHDNLHQRVGIVGSKNKSVEEIKKPCHNFGHDDQVPSQMSNEENLKHSIQDINKKMSALNPSTDSTLDNERGRERVYTIQEENRAPHHQQPPVYREPQTTGDRLHHQFNEHKPQKEQQDAKWWRREIQPTEQSAPFEDIRSVPTHTEYDCSGRCSNNVYDVHNHEQPRGAYNWQQGDNELAGNTVIIKCC
jgi:hypothetical protein